MSGINLDAIKARASAATEGPWEAFDRGIGYEVHRDEDRELNDGFRETFRQADAEFIAHARIDVPALLAEVERLRNTAEFLFGELQADEELRHGNYRDFSDVEELIAHLKEGTDD